MNIIRFLKYLLSNIDWVSVGFIIHFSICMSVLFLPIPYDKYIAYYIITSMLIAALQVFIIGPLKRSYEKFKKIDTL
jgi:hypothetical protein